MLVDIRDPRELERDGKVPGAFHMTRGMLEFWIDPESVYFKPIFGEDKKFVFFCAGGMRSALATKTAQDMGLEARRPHPRRLQGLEGSRRAGRAGRREKVTHGPYRRTTSWRGMQELVMATKQYPVTHTEAEWRKLLTPEQYAIMREHGTEAPGSCALNFEKRAGTFTCAGCDQPLFVSKMKFESGTGWPSFNDPVAGSVETSEDRSYGMLRTEAHCSRCGSHLGHVFDDGPPPTGQRYCINGVAMNFQPD